MMKDTKKNSKQQRNAVMKTLDVSMRHFRQLKMAVPKLHHWFDQNARDLPWRKTHDPYAIWVSEIMLQQTQVATVIPYFTKWMQTFPNISALAQSPLDEILLLWEGLGYYSRAKNFHRAAKQIFLNHGGLIPESLESFHSLPGVGPYTSAAVLSIAFNQDLAVVDGNVRRVLARLFAYKKDIKHSSSVSTLESLAQQLLPPGTARIHNQAMMELGALICTPRKPKCPACPFSTVCLAVQSASPEAFPRRSPKATTPHHTLAVAVIYDSDKILVYQRPYGGLLGGYWEFPQLEVVISDDVPQKLQRFLRQQFGIAIEIIEEKEAITHAYSHFKVTLLPKICHCSRVLSCAAQGLPLQWVTQADLKNLPMHRAVRKIIERL